MPNEALQRTSSSATLSNSPLNALCVGLTKMPQSSPDPDQAAVIWRETSRLVGMLVAGEYDGLAQISAGVRLSAHELRAAVDDYGVLLEVPPTPESARFSAIRVVASDPPRWSVRCDLWSAGEPCDLTLELTLCGPIDGRFTIELDNLHVL